MAFRLDDLRPHLQPDDRHWVIPAVARVDHPVALLGDVRDVRLVLVEAAVTSSAGLPFMGSMRPWYTWPTLAVTDDCYDFARMSRLVMNGHGLSGTPANMWIHPLEDGDTWDTIEREAATHECGLVVMDAHVPDMPARPAGLALLSRSDRIVRGDDPYTCSVIRTTLPAAIRLDGPSVSRYAAVQQTDDAIRFVGLPDAQLGALETDVLAALAAGPSTVYQLTTRLGLPTDQRGTIKSTLHELKQRGFVTFERVAPPVPSPKNARTNLWRRTDPC